MIIRRDFLTEELDVDLLKRVDTAELVQLVVDLVEDECLVVVGCVVLLLCHTLRGRRRQSEEGRTCHAQDTRAVPSRDAMTDMGVGWGRLGMMPGRVGFGGGGEVC